MSRLPNSTGTSISLVLYDALASKEQKRRVNLMESKTLMFSINHVRGTVMLWPVSILTALGILVE